MHAGTLLFTTLSTILHAALRALTGCAHTKHCLVAQVLHHFLCEKSSCEQVAEGTLLNLFPGFDPAHSKDENLKAEPLYTIFSNDDGFGVLNVLLMVSFNDSMQITHVVVFEFVQDELRLNLGLKQRSISLRHLHRAIAVVTEVIQSLCHAPDNNGETFVNSSGRCLTRKSSCFYFK